MIRTTTAVAHGRAGPRRRRLRRLERGRHRAADPQAGKATGTINVWAWGNEGEILGEMTKQFEAENPGMKVNVTPSRSTPRTTRSSPASPAARRPDVAMVGTTWMGELAAHADARRGARADRPVAVLQGRARHGQRRRRQDLRRAVVRRDAAPLLPHRHRQEGRHHRGAQDLGRAQGDGARDAGQGRREVRHQPLHQQLAGVPAVRVAGRRRPRQGRRVHAEHAAGRRGHRLLQVLRRRGPDARTRPSRASTSRPRSCAARTRCSSPARGTWA